MNLPFDMVGMRYTASLIFPKKLGTQCKNLRPGVTGPYQAL